MLSFFSRLGARYWKTPAGNIWTLYEDMSKQHNLLIAGTVGSGKSSVINGIIYNLLYRSPEKAQFILIDPKATELFRYKDLPHTICYAFEGPAIIKALEHATHIIEDRLHDMQKRRLQIYDGADIYLIIDDLADLFLTVKNQHIHFYNVCFYFHEPVGFMFLLVLGVPMLP